MLLINSIIRQLSGTLSLPNMGSLANKRRTTFDETEAGLDWNERNASSVLQVSKYAILSCNYTTTTTPAPAKI